MLSTFQLPEQWNCITVLLSKACDLFNPLVYFFKKVEKMTTFITRQQKSKRTSQTIVGMKTKTWSVALVAFSSMKMCNISLSFPSLAPWWWAIEGWHHDPLKLESLRFAWSYRILVKRFNTDTDSFVDLVLLNTFQKRRVSSPAPVTIASPSGDMAR